MLKRLDVTNFKSLANTSIELNKFNVLVGPNNSGKSNIMDAVMMLSTAISTRSWGGGYDYIRKKGGMRKYHYFGTPIEKPIRCVGYFEDNQGKFEYQITLTESTGKETPDFSWDRFKGTPWRFYRFIPLHMRSPHGISESLVLEDDGTNLSSVLHALFVKRHQSFSEIESHLKAVSKEIEHLSVPIVRSQGTQVAIKEKPFEGEFTADMMSDGTLSLLAHLVALYGPERPDLACFEESENFVHPHIIEHLIDIMKKSESQVIISTHSPTFLNHIKPEDLIIVSKMDGKTQCSRLSNPEKYRDIPLGELWYSGELGGAP